MTRETRLLPILLIASIFTLSNCGEKKQDVTHAQGSDEHDGHAMTDTMDSMDRAVSKPVFDVSEVFQQQLADVFKTYISLKEAFVSEDTKMIRAEAAAGLQALGRTDMKLLSGAAHHDWMTYLGAMERALLALENATDIDLQRKSFSTLTDNLYKSIKAYGLGGATAFYNYCPMAFNNQGGFWLSEVKQIRNPYFGVRMLTCGEVREELQ